MSTSIHAAKLFDNWLILQKVDANHKGLELGGIYELRVFRRETLHWINLLNRSSALLSRSLILHSNACNCSSSHTNFPFWNVLEIIDHLGISNCFDNRHDVDSSSKVVMILASSNTFTTLQSFLSEVVFFADCLELLMCLLGQLDVCLDLSSCIVSSFERQEQFLYSHLQVSEAFLHGVAEVKQDEWPSKLFLYCLLLQGLAEANLVARCAHHLFNAFVDAYKPPQTMAHCVNGCRGWRDCCLQVLKLLLNSGFVWARARRQTWGCQMGSHAWGWSSDAIYGEMEML